MKDEALRLALEALEYPGPSWLEARQPAITAIKQALEETPRVSPEPEPVAWRELLREARDNCKASIVEEGISASRKEYRIDLEARLTAALNTSPQRAEGEAPKREPLTDEQIEALRRSDDLFEDAPMWKLIARAIEAAHGIKGDA